jgi:prephenate dehydrogenase
MSVEIKPQIAIIGLGLMGGSLGSAFVRRGMAVSGWDADPAVVAEAYRIGAINRQPDNLAAALVGSDYVFVATPVSTIAAVIRDCLPLTAPGTVFSDLGSIKGQVVGEVKAFLPSDYYFVPGHPMTGSERCGIGAVDPFLFENAAYIVIQTDWTPETVTGRIAALVRTTGAEIINLTTLEHDRIVGMVSHLPHLVATVLAQTAGLAEAIHPGTLALAAGGFRDTTRIATGAPELWEGIIRGNREQIFAALTAFETQLHRVRQMVAADDRENLLEFLTAAREVRLQIPAKHKGLLSLLYEMVVTIEDRPGAIEVILRYLSQAKLNIKDIEILRVREGEGGTLRLAFENDGAVDQAVTILTDRGFKAWRRSSV